MSAVGGGRTFATDLMTAYSPLVSGIVMKNWPPGSCWSLTCMWYEISTSVNMVLQTLEHGVLCVVPYMICMLAPHSKSYREVEHHACAIRHGLHPQRLHDCSACTLWALQGWTSMVSSQQCGIGYSRRSPG